MDLIYVTKEVARRINSIDLKKLWDGFYPFDFAFYNDEKVFMYSNENINIFNWNDNFIGNTAIKLNEKYIAIWKLDELKDDLNLDKLTASILHEMFHCYQFEIGENRWANEVLNIEYPLDIENTAYRVQERKTIYNYLLEEDQEIKNNHLEEFVGYRNKRSTIIKEFISYEKAIESIEGTALYVEYSALKMLSNSNDYFRKYINPLVISNKDVLSIRSSSYVSGLALCLILDEYIDGWQKEYMSSTKYLYDYLIEKIKINKSFVDIIDLEHSRIIINEKKKEVNELFESFYNLNEIVTLEREFTLIGFDPMNIVKKDHLLYHRHMIKVMDGEKEKFIWGPLITCSKSSMFSIIKIIYDKQKNM